MSDSNTTQIACPYIAGGCPLFNTIAPVSTPSCSGGGCSPPTEKPASPIPQSQRRPSPPLAPLPPLPEIGSGRPPLPGASLWDAYLDFGLSPKPFDAEVFPLLLGQEVLPMPPGGTADSEKRGLLDIEELVMHPKRLKVVHQAEPIELVTSAETSSASGEEEHEDEPPTPFISKLVYLLGHREYQTSVRWDSQGKVVVLSHTKPETLEVLTQFFRHTTVASFVRQLNIYGFKRLSTAELLEVVDPAISPSTSAADLCAFRHPHFFRPSRGHPCRLGGLKPAKSRSKKRAAK